MVKSLDVRPHLRRCLDVRGFLVDGIHSAQDLLVPIEM